MGYFSPKRRTKKQTTNMNQYEQQTNLLDDLTRCLGVDIANYSIEESTDIEDEERRTRRQNQVPNQATRTRAET